MHFAAAECAAMPDDTVMLVNVPARGLRRPTTFFQKEPADFNIVRVTEQRRSMAVEALVCHTLELACSHPLVFGNAKSTTMHLLRSAQPRYPGLLPRRPVALTRAPTRAKNDAPRPAQVQMGRPQPPPPQWRHLHDELDCWHGRQQVEDPYLPAIGG